MTTSEIMALEKEQLLDSETVKLLLAEPTELAKQQNINDYLERCRQLKCKTAAEKLVVACKKDIKEENKTLTVNNTTHFEYGSELSCGMWIADKSGIKAFSDKGGYKLACYHPILPIERLYNVDTGTEKIVLAYLRDNKWQSITVDKDLIASASKIVKLSSFGIAVTSESAKNLVNYLADVENLNDITKTSSTSKLGWHGEEFLPFDNAIRFDDESRFKDIYQSICMTGSEEIWLDVARKVRANTSHYEPQVYMAASFASVLVSRLGMLPFIVNLWGGSGKGKTVALMLACSIWANPGESRYITDSYATQNAFEARLDVLNNLPLLMDDLSKTKDKYNDGFTDLVYLICSGKGKDRSNIDLGINKAKTWSNTILSNMERPLANDTMRGGAINRIIDIEMAPGNIFENGNAVANVLRDNYGFVGYVFVEIVKSLGNQFIIEMRKDFEQKIKDEAKAQESVKEEKQILPMSLILTADKIATDYIFKDGIYLDIPTMVKQLKDVNDVSEGQRAYESIMDYVNVYHGRFNENPSEFNYESWGFTKDGYVNIVPVILRRIAQEQNFSLKAFCQWAASKGILKSNNGKSQNIVYVNGKSMRFYSIKEETIEETSTFEAPNEASEEIPF